MPGGPCGLQNRHRSVLRAGAGSIPVLSALTPNLIHKTPVNQPRLRSIPAVESILQDIGPADLPRRALVAIVRRELAALRKGTDIPAPGAILQQIRNAVSKLLVDKIRPVINGTGIILHTNLGRAPQSPATTDALVGVSAGYCNLEIDLTGGSRGQRARYLEHNLALLCGAGAATVVNNGAAALILIVRHFSVRKPEIVISRGELVQIGGGFRVPDILETSGGRLREVGTTNKTTLEDYERAIGPDTGMILKVHRSNFFMSGFVDSPASTGLAALARRKRIPFIEDLGSGAVSATEKISGLEHEPTPAEVLGHGADLVCFSGDKLLGGPQAGIIAGRKKMVDALRKDPFFRALRCGKLVLTALQSTVDQCLDGKTSHLPVMAMLEASRPSLLARADKITAALAGHALRVSTGEGTAQVGGGTLPRSTVASVTINISPGDLPLAVFSQRLRLAAVPVVGSITKNHFKIDLRTVFPHQDGELVQGLLSAIAEPPSGS